MTEQNPFIQQHIEAETVFQGGDRRTAEALVRNEYAGAPESAPHNDACGGIGFYKATIGAVKCTRCGKLWDSLRQEWY